jgi:hypothetical protein
LQTNKWLVAFAVLNTLVMQTPLFALTNERPLRIDRTCCHRSLSCDPLPAVFTRDLNAIETNYVQSIGRFAAWRKHFTHPTACRMVLCHGSCEQSGAACPSFTGLTVLDLHNIGLLIDKIPCAMSSGHSVQADLTY